MLDIIHEKSAADSSGGGHRKFVLWRRLQLRKCLLMNLYSASDALEMHLLVWIHDDNG